jgi:hypothetical protein
MIWDRNGTTKARPEASCGASKTLPHKIGARLKSIYLKMTSQIETISKAIIIIIVTAVITCIIGIYLPNFLPSPHVLQEDNLSSSCFVDHYPPSLKKDELDKALRWEYLIDCDHYNVRRYSICWASIQLELQDICNISDYKGIAFDIRAEKPICSTDLNINTLEFSIYIQNDKNNEKYQYWTGKNNSNMSLQKNRCLMTILFSDLLVPEWINKNNSVPRSPDLTNVSMLTLDIPTNNHTSNILWIYNIFLIHNNGSLINVTSHADPLKTDAPMGGHWKTTTGFKLLKE